LSGFSAFLGPESPRRGTASNDRRALSSILGRPTMPEAPRESGTSGAIAREAQQQSAESRKANGGSRGSTCRGLRRPLDSSRAAGVADQAPQAQLDERRE
jgi:hypothetical protein